MKVADLNIQRNVRIVEPGNSHSLKKPLNGADKLKDQAPLSFEEILQEKVKGSGQVRFSSHALRRLESRQLTPSMEDLSRLNQGIKQVEQKGSRNSIILIDDTAYIVSIRNKTVITAVNKSETEQNVFTNIDSLAIV